MALAVKAPVKNTFVRVSEIVRMNAAIEFSDLFQDK
jgi:hypothetical protein